MSTFHIMELKEIILSQDEKLKQDQTKIKELEAANDIFQDDIDALEAEIALLKQFIEDFKATVEYKLKEKDSDNIRLETENRMLFGQAKDKITHLEAENERLKREAEELTIFYKAVNELITLKATEENKKCVNCSNFDSRNKMCDLGFVDIYYSNYDSGANPETFSCAKFNKRTKAE